MALSNLISDAEWHIMRSIWTTVPTTSSDIVEALNTTTGWTSATVKTLLARLVTKKIISFDMKGRTRMYYPLISEEECIKEEMKTIIDKFYGGYVNLETEHLIFKGDHDPGYISLLAETLEQNYLHITKDLEYSLNEKLLVYTHISQKRLHSALGLLDGPNWLRAGHAWDILHIAPKTCFNEIAAEKAAVHILTQIIINKINPSVPYWLLQAISAYESKWLSKERIIEAVKSSSKSSSLSEMIDIRKDYIVFKETRSYELSYTVAEYIVNEFGIETLAKMLRNPHDYQGILNVSENQFWKNWHNYLITYYV